jgi:pyridoxamine 5'-phosphate oxidase
MYRLRAADPKQSKIARVTLENCARLTLMQDLYGERTEYKGEHLLESHAPADPFVLFDTWLADAFAAKERGLLPEPTAMVIATCVDDQPSARTVLLKNVSDQGFTFFTNYNSRKGGELSRNRQVALLFGWYELHRQVRAEGTAELVPRAESEAYFATRPRESQLGAWASEQSTPVASLDELARAYAAAERRFRGVTVPCPEHWGGYRVIPTMIEFWQGQPSRMHDRLLYRRAGTTWQRSRLAP